MDSYPGRKTADLDLVYRFMMLPGESTRSSNPVNKDRLSCARPDLSSWLEAVPSLDSHAEITTRPVRGKTWWFIHNGFTGRHIRLNRSAMRVVRLCDGERSVRSLLSCLDSSQQTNGLQTKEAVVNSGDSRIPIMDTLELLARLSRFGVLSGMPANELKPSASGRQALNPLAIKVPLVDPDNLLDRLAKRTGWIFTLPVLMAWLISMISLIALSFTHAEDLRSMLGRATREPHYWLLLWLSFPILKALHEIAHGLVIKCRGGAVHELGITLLVLAPVPYVDASASWSFPERRWRMLVSAVGVMVELFVALLALLLFVLMEPGVARDAAFVVFMTGTLSTLLFNGNPLLRFDGYYVLQDLVDIPNLYTRSGAYLRYLVRRYVLSVEAAETVAHDDNEKFWLVTYGLASLVYRYVLMVVIALWLTSTLFFIGAILSLWLVYAGVVKPISTLFNYLRNSPELDHRRVRVNAALAAALSVTTAILLFMPVAHSTRTQGIVWVEQPAEIYAGVEGRVARVLARPGDWVVSAQPLVELENPELMANIAVLEAERHRLQLQYAAATVVEPAVQQERQAQLHAMDRELLHLQQKRNQLTISAQSDGVFHADPQLDLTGQYFKEGELLGYVINASELIARLVVTQQQIKPVQKEVTQVSVRLAERFSEPLKANVSRITPAADHALPSAALGTPAGGGIPIADLDQDGLTTRVPVFHVEVELPTDLRVAGIGERVYAQLQHPATPVAERLLDALRRLVLSQLPV